MKTKVNSYLFNGQKMVSSHFKWFIGNFHFLHKYQMLSKVYSVFKDFGDYSLCFHFYAQA